MSRKVSNNLVAFLLVWSGQLLSLMGTGLSSFGLAVWIYQSTSSVTQYSLVALCTTFPGVLIAPLAGTLVDRWNRRWTMLVSDLCAGLCMLALALLAFSGQLDLWSVCVGTGIGSICGAFQRPAYFALVSEMVPQKQLGRANGMLQFSSGISQLLAPVLAGALLSVLRLQGLFLLDLLSFLFSVVTLLFARTNQMSVRKSGTREIKPSALLHDVVSTWEYLQQQGGIIALLVLFTLINFLIAMVSVLVQPMILSFASPAILGIMLSICGSGMLAGALVMSIWGGLRRRMDTILIFLGVGGVCLIVAGARPSVSLITGAGFCFFFCLPLINGSVSAILQHTVVPTLHGRLFSLLDMTTGAAIPLADLLAGSLADNFFLPALRKGGWLASTIGQVIGVGQGRGIGLLFIIVGLFILCVAIWGASYARLHYMEDHSVDVS